MIWILKLWKTHLLLKINLESIDLLIEKPINILCLVSKRKNLIRRNLKLVNSTIISQELVEMLREMLEEIVGLINLPIIRGAKFKEIGLQIEEGGLGLRTHDNL